MIARYREYAPCPALARNVRALFSFSVEPAESVAITSERAATRDISFDNNDPFWSTTFADGHLSIVVNAGDEYRISGIWERHRARPHAIGPMSRFHASSYGTGLIQVGAYLKPGRARELTGAPASELAERAVALEDLWGTPGVELEERFQGSSNEEERVACIEAALVHQLRVARQRSGGSFDATRVAGAIAARRGQLTISGLADSAGVSRQHLARVFRENVGVCPKLYARLARFQAALGLAASRATDWAQAAAALGYADQSHLIAEFRSFSGLTPERFVRERCFHPFQGR